MDEPDAAIDDPGWLTAFDGGEPSAVAPQGDEPLGVLAARFGTSLALFVGTGLVAGASAQVPGAPVAALALALAGVLLFAGAGLLGGHTDRDPRSIGCAVVLALGLGALVGGVQSLGAPDRAGVLLPIGLALSCAALAVQRGIELRGVAGSTLVAGVVVAAFVVHHGLGVLAPAPQPEAVAPRTVEPAAARKPAVAPGPAAAKAADDAHAPAGEDEHAAAKAADDAHAPDGEDAHAPAEDEPPHAPAEDEHPPAAAEHDDAHAPAEPSPSRGFEFLSPADEAEIEALERAAVEDALAGTGH